MAPTRPVHSDSRRDLYEFEYPVSKIIVSKEGCVIGNHYHKLKDEEFLLVNGEGRYRLGGMDQWEDMKLMQSVKVEAGRMHTFELAPGSIMVCYCSGPHNESDVHTA